MKNPSKTSHMIVSFLILVSLTVSLEAKSKQKSSLGQDPAWMTELNLSSEQMKQINQLRDGMQPAMMDVRHKTRTMELELKRLERDTQKNAPAIDRLKASIKANNEAIAALQKNHRAQVRALLTPDQQLIYDEYGQGSRGSRKFRSSRGENSDPMNGRGNHRWNRG